MSFRNFKWVFTQFGRARSFRNITQHGQGYRKFHQDFKLPCTVGFSIFTWLGFNQKLSAEDELIKTIKHCIIFIRNTDYERAEQLLHVALRQAQQIRHELGITYIYDVMANLALEREQFEKAKKLFVSVSQRLLADGVPQEDPRVVHISMKLARISHMQKEYKVAQIGYDWCMEQLDKLMEISPDMGTKQLLAITQDWYGRLFLDCQQYDHGVKLMVKALDNMREVTDIEQEHIATQMNDIGTALMQQGKVDESLTYIQEAINIAKTCEEFEYIGSMYVNLGRVYLQKSMLDEARKSCGYALRLGHESKNEDIKKEANECIKEVRAANG